MQVGACTRHAEKQEHEAEGWNWPGDVGGDEEGEFLGGFMREGKGKGRGKRGRVCYSCGGEGHFARRRQRRAAPWRQWSRMAPRAAGGKVLRNQGERLIRGLDGHGSKKGLMVERGNRVTFAPEGSYIEYPGGLAPSWSRGTACT